MGGPRRRATRATPDCSAPPMDRRARRERWRSAAPLGETHLIEIAVRGAVAGAEGAFLLDAEERPAWARRDARATGGVVVTWLQAAMEPRGAGVWTGGDAEAGGGHSTRRAVSRADEPRAASGWERVEVARLAWVDDAVATRRRWWFAEEAAAAGGTVRAASGGCQGTTGRPPTQP